MAKSLERIIIKPKANNRFLRLLHSQCSPDLKGKIVINRVEIDREKNCSLFIALAPGINQDELEGMEELLRGNLSDFAGFKIIFEPWEKANHDRIQEVLRGIKSRFPQFGSCLENLEIEEKDGEIELSLPSKTMVDFLKAKKLDQIISQKFAQNGLPDKIKFSQKRRKRVPGKTKEKQPKEKKGKKDHRVVKGRLLPEAPQNLSSILDQGEGVFVVEGEVFSKTVHQSSRGGTIQIVNIADRTAALTVKIFNLEEELQKGGWYKFRGQMEYDNFSGEKVLFAEDILEVTPISRKDNFPEKRFELHLHTKMSDMDGVIDIDQLAKTLKRWGHRGAAITDHGVVQSFPNAYEAFQQEGLKLVLGLEANTLPEQEVIYSGREESSWNEFPLVFLDIETTGFSPWQHEIIEIGAVRVEKGSTSEFQQLVRPKKAPSEEIIDLTGIDPKELKKARPLKEVWPEFIDFINGAILVAHNANFDIDFLRFWGKKMGQNLPLENGFLDTLSLSKAINSDLRGHSLGALTKKFNVRLDDHHRALADSQATYRLWEIFCSKLEAREIKNLKQLKELSREIPWFLKFTKHNTLWARNKKGLFNLYRLVSTSHLDYFHRHPCIPWEWLEKNREGIILGSGCLEGPLYDRLLGGAAKEELKEIAFNFDYIEILSPNYLVENSPVEDIDIAREITSYLVSLAEELGKIPIAISDAHYLEREEKVFRDILLHQKGNRQEKGAAHLLTTEEMMEQFNFLGEDKARKIVIENPNFLAEEVPEMSPVPEGLYPPHVPGAEDRVKNRTIEKARKLYGKKLPEIVKKRIDKELHSIIGQGFAPIYAISQTLVGKSLEIGYLVGSRGSVGSSFVAFLCEITEINPLPAHYRCPGCFYTDFEPDKEIDCGLDLGEKECPKCGESLFRDGFDIPFEVFLGFRGEKVPDIDLNFAGEIQNKIHAYTEEIFGKDNVFRAGTISTIASRTAYGMVKGYLEENHLQANRAQVERLIKGCSGVRRTTGQHPGGLMVLPADKDIHEFTPIQYPANDSSVGVQTTHFDYRSISSRLLKLDLLGHDDPTALKQLEGLTGINVQDIPFNDPPTMSIFSGTEALELKGGGLNTKVGSLGVPEYGTPFVRGMLEETRPETMGELIRISGLSHGENIWRNNAQDLISAGEISLKQVISTRDDILNDLIRWGVEPEKAFPIMEKVRKGKGMSAEEEELLRDKKVPEWYIESCKKIKYMFPKAHAAAYVLMSYRIAYFKVHHPSAFYATYLSTKGGEFEIKFALEGLDYVNRSQEKIKEKGREASPKEKATLTLLEILQEAMLRGVEFLNVDLYKSHSHKFLLKEGRILPPLTSIPHLGQNCAQRVVKARDKKKFSSIEDFSDRTQANKNVVEAMVKYGVLKGLPAKNQLSLF